MGFDDTLLGSARVRIRPDMDGFSRDVDNKVGAAMRSAAKIAAGAFVIGISGAIVGIKKAVDATSDLNESANAVKVTFGDAAGEIEKLSKKSAKSMGLSSTEFNNLSVRFSNFAMTVAGDGGDASKVIEDLTGRAADFASVMNLDVAEAAEVFQSGLAGETEPLRKYGIDLSAAAVEAYALANGINDGTHELTEAEKVQARYGLLMASTNKTAGDFIKTQGGVANQSRIIASQWTNLKAIGGEAFTPLAETVLPKLNEGLTWMIDSLTANMPAIKQDMAEFGTRIGEVVDRFVENWPQIQERIRDTAAALRDAWPEIKEAAASLGDALERVGGLAKAAWDAFQSMPPEAQQTIATLAMLDATGVIDVKLVVTPMLSAAVGGIFAAIFTGAAATVSIPVTVAVVVYVRTVTWAWNQDWYADPKRLVETTMGMIFEDGAMEGIKRVPGVIGRGMAANAKAIAEGLAQPFVVAWQSIATYTTTAWEVISTAVKGRLMDLYLAVGGWGLSVVSSVSAAWEAVKSTVAAALAVVSATVSGVMSSIAATWSGWWTSIRDRAGEMIGGARDRIGQGLESIKSLFSGAVSAIGAIWDRVTGVVRAPIAEMFGWINRNMVGPINSVLGVFSDSLKISDLPIPSYHTGGYTSGVGGREGLALLRNDEFVVNPDATRKNRALLEAINAGRMGFGIGGPFDGISDLLSQVKSWAMQGAAFAMGKVADPALDWLRDTFGGSWSPDMVIAGMGEAVNAANKWASGEDSKRAAQAALSSVSGGYIGPGTGILGRPLSSYAVTSEFGPRWGTMHAGIDLGAPGGTPIYAAAAGKIMQAGWYDGYGNYIRMDHGGGLGTSYGHMSRIIAQAGQTVAAQALIGLVGTTGDSTGDHLHFEVFSGGSQVNPRGFVQFDRGGYLQPGWSAVYNGTGRPEPVFTDKQWKKISGGQVGNGVTINVTNHYPQAEPTSVTTSRTLRLLTTIGGM